MSDERDEPDELTYLLDGVFRLERAVTRIGNLRLTPWHLSLSSYAAMRIIETKPRLSLAQLSRRCFVRPQTMTRIVSTLRDRGYVERTANPESERAMSLTLTREGISVLREMDAEVLQINDSFARALDGDERAELVRMLRTTAILVEEELRELER
ncbi:MarR family winged helix-turn-helix transcriptional regulator [Aeromicrobium tamlense]|uniref:DNA-binding MarR family transcriptional regulator n=1 Tax=Aeromicrobium tamlense TaxID=375541 RepID=A0ABX2SGW6_9ACTN|nr:MarR family transcriptional regulator [Aeromicrobium tamlense]NYI38143.1 DNA-binding MarR family transcriptional regulator [Aeromicrobium tamlense]